MIIPRPYQKDGLDAIWNYFNSGGKGNPLLCWPTGTGKSIVPAIFITAVMKIWPTQRFLMVTHVKELISQNYEELIKVWPNAPVGIYSAGLKSKQAAMPIVYGGIQSMNRNPYIFGHRDIIFIDEAHLISTDDASSYLMFLSIMKLINPNVKIVGMTATPFRMGQGMITDGGIFTDIVHDLTSLDSFNKMIEEGYIAPLVPQRTQLSLDVSNVKIQGGEFVLNQLQGALDKSDITHKGLLEFTQAAHNRRSWLLFASGIEHAEHIAEMLRTVFNIDCAAVHSKQNPDYNDAAIQDYKDGKLRSIVNFGKLTTGFNHKPIDAIGMFRPTMSVPLWIQMLGRGTRVADGKTNCLVMDFATNTKRLGPINDPVIPRKKGEGTGEAPVKICEACGVYNHTRVRFCTNCGQEFQFEVKITARSGKEELIKNNFPIIENYDVFNVTYSKKQKLDKAPYIKVTYQCGFHTFSENVFPEGIGLAHKKYVDWFRQRHVDPPPVKTDLVMAYTSNLRKPKKITVHVNLKWPEIKACEW